MIRLTQSALLRQIAYLKAENRISRSRIPGAVRGAPAERTILLRLGRCLGISFRNLISIVNYKTWLSCVRADRKSSRRRTAPTPGRPATNRAVAEIMPHVAREGAWVCSRIQGELVKLGIVVARNTVKNILIKNGFHPGPGKHVGDCGARFDYMGINIGSISDSAGSRKVSDPISHRMSQPLHL
ncbi:MAG: hypothetical protein SNJ52_00515 [Verrucomicrobiia bacterium]